MIERDLVRDLDRHAVLGHDDIAVAEEFNGGVDGLVRRAAHVGIAPLDAIGVVRRAPNKHLGVVRRKRELRGKSGNRRRVLRRKIECARCPDLDARQVVRTIRETPVLVKRQNLPVVIRTAPPPLLDAHKRIGGRR